MRPKLLLLIPVHNAERTIEGVLTRLSEEVAARVDAAVVIDNASADDTRAIVRRVQRSRAPIAGRLALISNPRNYGYGGSQKVGYRFAIDNGFTHLIVLHGDDQTDGDALLRRFLAVLDRDPAIELVLASRFTAGSDTRGYDTRRVLGNRFFTFATRVLTGVSFTDHGAALMLVRTDLLARLPFERLTDGYRFHPELNLLLYQDSKVRRTEVPLEWHDSNSPSALNVWRYGVTLLGHLTRYAIRRRLLRQDVATALGADGVAPPAPQSVERAA